MLEQREVCGLGGSELPSQERVPGRCAMAIKVHATLLESTALGLEKSTESPAECKQELTRKKRENC